MTKDEVQGEAATTRTSEQRSCGNRLATTGPRAGPWDPARLRAANLEDLVIATRGVEGLRLRVVTNRIGFPFDATISVDDVSSFKPSPQVYRYAARVLQAEPAELMMISAHSFDAVGARASGYRAAYVNRYDQPYDETTYGFDVEASDFINLADKLRCN